MDNLKVVTQGELFPEDSQFHSKYAYGKHLKEMILTARHEEVKTGRPTHDITGERFGMLTAVCLTDEQFNGQFVWVCQCDCGHSIKALSSHLRREKNPLNHCGCQGVGRHGTPRPGQRGIGGYNSPNRPPKSKPMVAFTALKANYRLVAAKRGYEWKLTSQQFLDLTQGNCHYCGAEPQQVYKSYPHEFTYNGVDRLDSSKSYTPDNCVSCCGACNTAKMDRPVGEFLDWIERVYEYQRSR